MTAFWLAMATVIGFVAIIFVVPLVMVLVSKYRATTPVQVTSVTTTTAQWYQRPIIQIAVVILAIALLFFAWQSTEPSTQTISLLIGITVIAILAILGIMGKAGKVGKIALGIVVLSLVLFGTRTPEVVERLQRSASEKLLDGGSVALPSLEPRIGAPSAPQARDRDVSVTWKESGKDDTLPVGIWSESLRVPVGCSAIFYPGNGTSYTIRYRSQNQEWKQLPGKADVHGDEIQVMNLEPRTIAPVLLRCKQ